MSLLSESDPITTGNPSYFPLTDTGIDELDHELNATGLRLKNDWFAYNGGSTDADHKTYKKPLFFNIALNYAQLDMDRLHERAGKTIAATTTASKVESAPEKKQTTKAEVEEVRAATPVPQAPRGGLSSLLGGWWGKS